MASPETRVLRAILSAFTRRLGKDETERVISSLQLEDQSEAKAL